MYNQNSNVFMNGGHGPQRYMQMNSSKPFQPGQHHSSHHQRQQDHNGFSNHQHNPSSGGFSSGTPNFNPSNARHGTPNQMQNGISRPTNEHWQLQLALAERARTQTGAHAHARNHPGNKMGPSNALEQARLDGDREEGHRSMPQADQDQSSWNMLDLSGQGLKSLSPGVFIYPFLKKLYLSQNKLTRLHPSIGKLRGLTELDVSINSLRSLPNEIGMLVNLKSLLLFDNNLEELPYELGYLYQLDVLGIEGNNLLDDSVRTIVQEHGTRALITSLQDHAEAPEPPNDRDWIVVDDALTTTASPLDKVTVMSYNTLCDRAATSAQYGYTAPEHLSWEHRKHLILSEFRARDPDILCMQEVEQDAFREYFAPELAMNGYRSSFHPKARARTMSSVEAKQVDGCATLYKDKTWILLEKQTIDFANAAINRPDMKSETDIFNRVMPRDHVALVTFLENRYTGARLIVVNAHIEWNPAHRDVKVIQTAILMEFVTKLADQFSKVPPLKEKKLFKFADGDSDASANGVEPEMLEPAPSQEYSSGQQIPLLLCVDFNSTPDSGVYELMESGSLSRDHPDLGDFKYGKFTREGMHHPFSLRSSYSEKDMPFTNYTPHFQGMIDYIWYASNTLQVTGLLGKIDEEYLRRVPGFPNAHYPSDHIALMSELVFKQLRGQGTSISERR